MESYHLFLMHIQQFDICLSRNLENKLVCIEQINFSHQIANFFHLIQEN